MHFLLQSGLGTSSSLPIEELEYVTGECAGVLKQRPVTRVWVDDELRVRQMLAQRERVDCGNHDVVIPIGDKYGLSDFLQIGMGLTSGLLPGTHCCELRTRCLRSSWSVLILRPLCKPLDKLASSRLAAFGGFEKQFE